MQPYKPTIYDIARRAGVSTSTVSRVLNGTAKVESQKRADVLRAIEEMDYRPSTLARGLSSQRTMTIGLLLPEIVNPYYSTFAYEVEREAMAHGYAVILCNTMDSYLRDTKALELRYIDMLTDKRVDGAIIIGGSLEATHRDKRYVDALQRMGDRLPLVQVSPTPIAAHSPTLYCDKIDGIRNLVIHLAQSGYRSMGFLAGRRDISSSKDCVRAFLATTKEVGITTKSEWIVGDNDTMAAGQIAAQTLLALKRRPEALLCFNDLLAIGCMHALMREGLRIPEDIAIAGCDNIELSGYVTPALTTIDLMTTTLARGAVSTLVEKLSGGTPAAHVVIPPKIIARASTRQRAPQ